jgi:hypothetical protein
VGPKYISQELEVGQKYWSRTQGDYGFESLRSKGARKLIKSAWSEVGLYSYIKQDKKREQQQQSVEQQKPNETPKQRACADTKRRNRLKGNPNSLQICGIGASER